jgi:CRISPR-associated protein Cas5d
LFLRDVRYRLHGWFEFIPPEKRKNNRTSSPEFWADEAEMAQTTKADETPAKYAAMFERRAKKGQCFHRPYLGCREFACHFSLVDGETTTPPISENRDLGFMLYDIDFTDLKNPMPQFFRAELKQGVVITDRKRVEVRG